MGEVLSFTEAAAKMAELGGEVIAVRAPAEDLASRPPAGLTFAGGASVTIRYRKIEGRNLLPAVLFGCTARDVIAELRRGLDRTSDEFLACPGKEGEAPDVAYIDIAPRQPNAGLRVAQVKGVHFDQLNAARGDDVSMFVFNRATGTEVRSVLATPSIAEVIRRLERNSGLSADQLIARPEGTPEPWDLTRVELGPEQPGAGARVARVFGVTFTQLNIALGRPVKQIEQWHEEGHVFDPEAPAWRAFLASQKHS